MKRSSRRIVPPMPASERRIARIMGMSAILVGSAGLFLTVANWSTRLHGGRDISSIAPTAVAFCLLGLGSLLGLRVALYLLAAGSALVGVWLGLGSIGEVPFPWLLFNLALAAAFVFPAITLARLRGRGMS
jgi:hypothetical protein